MHQPFKCRFFRILALSSIKQTSYIGGKRSDHTLVSKYKSISPKHSFLSEKINHTFYGRGYFALRAILKARLRQSKHITVHCPAYNCWNTFKRAIESEEGILVKVYKKPEDLKINIDNSQYDNCVLIVDYFGVSDYQSYLEVLDEKCIKIFDLAHAFPTDYLIENIMTFADYSFLSFRKVLPVADGAIAFSNKADLIDQGSFKTTSSAWRLLTFLSRFKLFDNFADRAGFRYSLFKAHESTLVSNSFSRKSLDVFCSIDLDSLLEKRKKNYEYLDLNLITAKENLPFKIRNDNLYPLYYPWRVSDIQAAQTTLIKSKIYCPVFWPELNSEMKVIGLPIDDRYSVAEMNKIIETIGAIE